MSLKVKISNMSQNKELLLNSDVSLALSIPWYEVIQAQAPCHDFRLPSNNIASLALSRQWFPRKWYPKHNCLQTSSSLGRYSVFNHATLRILASHSKCKRERYKTSYRCCSGCSAQILLPWALLPASHHYLADLHVYGTLLFSLTETNLQIRVLQSCDHGVGKWQTRQIKVGAEMKYLTFNENAFGSIKDPSLSLAARLISCM